MFRVRVSACTDRIHARGASTRAVGHPPPWPAAALWRQMWASAAHGPGKRRRRNMRCLGLGTMSPLYELNAQSMARHRKVAAKQRLRRSHHAAYGCPLRVPFGGLPSHCGRVQRRAEGSSGRTWLADAYYRSTVPRYRSPEAKRAILVPTELLMVFKTIRTGKGLKVNKNNYKAVASGEHFAITRHAPYSRDV